MSKKYKLGIFLEAGGNAVFFSNGVLKSLRAKKIEADFVVGYSSSSAIMLAYIFDCCDYALEIFGGQLNENRKNFYFFRRDHFPHEKIYHSSIKSVLINSKKNKSNSNIEFKIIAAKTSRNLAKIKALLASCVLLLNKNGADFRRLFNKFFKIKKMEFGRELIDKPNDLLEIIMGSSCLYPFIKTRFFDGELILEGGLIKPDFREYLEDCERGIVIHTITGKTGVRDGVLQIYSSQKLPFNVLDYTDENKLKIMQKAGEEEVWNNLDLIKEFVG